MEFLSTTLLLLSLIYACSYISITRYIESLTYTKVMDIQRIDMRKEVIVIFRRSGPFEILNNVGTLG